MKIETDTNSGRENGTDRKLEGEREREREERVRERDKGTHFLALSPHLEKRKLKGV